MKQAPNKSFKWTANAAAELVRWASAMRRIGVLAAWALLALGPLAYADEWTLVHKGENGAVYATRIHRTDGGATFTSKVVLAEPKAAASKKGNVRYNTIVADDEVRCKDRTMTTTKIGLVTLDGEIMLEKPPANGTYRPVPADQTAYTADAVLFRYFCEEHSK
ncbi:MAG: hypothetical protein JWR16_3419 [Nevskia sp.]|nr:hypothetical protein [Nevskia sp.]